MPINIILLILGLIICFGGIYIKKICGFVLGFSWGAITAFFVELAIIGFSIFAFLEFDKEELIAILVLGAIFGILSAIFDKVCVAISSFLSFFSISTLFMLLFDILAGAYMFIIAALISFIFSFISTKIYNYSFIFFSALTGAFIATIGGYGIYREIEFYSVIKKFLFNDDARMIILVITFIFTLIGFSAQLYRFNYIKNKKSAQNSNSPNDINNDITSNIYLNANGSTFLINLKKLLNIIMSNWYFSITSFLYLFSEFSPSHSYIKSFMLCLTLSVAIYTTFNKKNAYAFLWLIPTTPVIIKEFISMTRYASGSSLYLSNIFNLLVSPGLIYISIIFALLLLKIFRKKNIFNKKKFELIYCSIFLSLSFFYSYIIGVFEESSLYHAINKYDISPIYAFFCYMIGMIFFYLLQSFYNKKDCSISFTQSLKEQLKPFLTSSFIIFIVFASCTLIHAMKPAFIAIKGDLSSSSDYECYNQMISKYVEELSIGYDAYLDKGYQTNYNLITYHYEYGEDVAYSMYDIDSNGIPELLFGDTKEIFEIYTISDDKCVNYFPEYEFGYKNSIQVLSNGLIYVSCAGGAYWGFSELYEINPDGSSVDVIEAYYFNNIERNMQLEQTHQYVSLEKYNSIYYEFKGLDIFDSLEWKIIS